MKLSRLIDNLSATDEEVLITGNGRPAAVLVSLDDFEGWRETNAIRSDTALVKEIQKVLMSLKKGAKLYSLEELFNTAEQE